MKKRGRGPDTRSSNSSRNSPWSRRLLPLPKYRYWGTDYDWRKCEAELNALPQFKTAIDGLDINFIHVRSPHENALPLIITHGWPGSVIEMLEVVGPLTDPTAHGGRAEDAFDLVLPSLPGFGFSEQPKELGWDQGRTAQAWAELMNRLGYTRFVAQGGDQGASVTDAMVRMAPDGLTGVHLNFLSAFPTDVLAAVFGAGAAHRLFKRLAVATLAAHAEKQDAAALEGSRPSSRGATSSRCPSTRRRSASP
jgi:pimeloyl-ACP methyl ester carboxylesterase